MRPARGPIVHAIFPPNYSKIGQFVDELPRCNNFRYSNNISNLKTAYSGPKLVDTVCFIVTTSIVQKKLLNTALENALK